MPRVFSHLAVDICTQREAEHRDIIVLFTGADDPTFREFEDPMDACRFFDLEEFDFQRRYPPARVVVLTGHSRPPNHYLNKSPEGVAAVIDCFKPDLVVADTCYGFSSPLMVSMLERHLAPFFVGPTDALSAKGFLYEDDFFEHDCTLKRAEAVRRRSGSPLMRWRIDESSLRDALDDLASWSPAQLHGNLQRVHPNLVKVVLPRTAVTVLVPVDPPRFRTRGGGPV